MEDKITDIGMDALNRLGKIIPKMTERQKERFADVVDGMVIMSEYMENKSSKKRSEELKAV